MQQAAVVAGRMRFLTVKPKMEGWKEAMATTAVLMGMQILLLRS